MEVFHQVLKRHGRASRIDWFNWGEPLLHKEFLTIAEILKDTNSRISSNLSLPLSNEQLESLNNFKIIYVSLSGMTPETYNVYHRGGKHDLVMENLCRFLELNKTHLRIRWLMHKYNDHELNKCRKFCNENDIHLECVPLNAEVENLLSGDFDHELYSKTTKRQKRTTCHIINWLPIGYDGRYYLCCASHNVDTGYTVFDDISYEDLLEVKRKLPLCVQCQEHEVWKFF
jgi:MoaA/NifB/PqqE/SkfB family radical SAM enzyme